MSFDGLVFVIFGTVKEPITGNDIMAKLMTSLAQCSERMRRC